MSKVCIEFDLDNAAFEDNFEEELNRVLVAVGRRVKIQVGRIPGTGCIPKDPHILYDINGNSIGTVKWEP